MKQYTRETKIVSSSLDTRFESELMEQIKQMEDKGYKVNIQYHPVESGGGIYLSALVIGYEVQL